MKLKTIGRLVALPMAATVGAAALATEPEGPVAPPGAAATSVEGAALPRAVGAHETEPVAVTGAFGIPLGEPFAPGLVAKVLREEDHRYRGSDLSPRTGKRYWVEPRVPNPHFTSYAVDLTTDGQVYAIRAEHAAPDRASKCDVVSTLVAFLEQKYGEPRGRGLNGEWYSFRDTTADSYKGIRLYANRCARGVYSIVYSDDRVRFAASGSASEAKPSP